MTDSNQNLKKDAGKPRYDLLPWHEFQTIAVDHSVASVYEALKMWWRGRPNALELSIPERQIPGIAQVLAFGAAKYAPRGWEAGIPLSRVFAAAARHATAHNNGEMLDPESGLPHESHFWCNVLFIAVFAARGRTDLDDRPEAVPEVVEYLGRIQATFDALTGRTPPPTPRPEGVN